MNWIIIPMLLSFIILKWILNFSFFCSIVLEFLFFVVKWKCIHGNWKWKVQMNLKCALIFYNILKINFHSNCVYLLGAFMIGVPQQESKHLFVLSFEVRIGYNECFEMLNTERGICMFQLSTNKCYNEWFKSIEQILNVLFKYNPKRNARLQDISRNDILSFGMPKPY